MTVAVKMVMLVHILRSSGWPRAVSAGRGVVRNLLVKCLCLYYALSVYQAPRMGIAVDTKKSPAQSPPSGESRHSHRK